MKFIEAIQPYRFSLHLVFVPLLIMAVEYGGLFILGVPIFGYLLIPSIDFLLRQYKLNDLMIKELIEAFAQSAGLDPREAAKSIDEHNRPRSMPITDWQSLLPSEQRKYEYLFPRS